MENMADALKIAFGVLVFIIAITVTFMLLSQAKATTDVVMFVKDETNYYDNYKGNKDNDGRIVGVDTVISSIYRAWEESYTITIKGIESNDIVIDTDADIYGSVDIFNNSIKDIVEKLNNKNFKETFDYITYTGKYKIEGEEKITITPGYTKTHITYKVIT